MKRKEGNYYDAAPADPADCQYNLLFDSPGFLQGCDAGPMFDLFSPKDEEGDVLQSDFYDTYHPPLISHHAKKLFEQHAPGMAQYIPCASNVGEPLYLVNVLNCLDILDEGQSDIWRLPDTGRTIMIDRHVFREDVSADVGIFRLPYEATRIYFGSDIVEAIVRSGLCGATPKLIWPEIEN